MNATHEFAVLKEMAGEFEEFLLADSLFWQMQARSDFPQLSLGMMLLTRARLHALHGHLSPAERMERERTEMQIDGVLSRWPVVAEHKAEKELRARLNLWQAFLSECRDAPHTCAENYAQDVTHRAMAALLLRQFPRLSDSPEAGRLPGMDAQLRPRLKPGTFVWLAELQSEFPPGEFWFLYGRV